MALNLNPSPGDNTNNLLWKILSVLQAWIPGSNGLLGVTLAEGLNSTDDKVSVEKTPGAPNWTAVQVSVASAVNLFPARATRRHALIKNTHGTISAYLGPDAGVLTTTGYELKAGQEVRLETTAAAYAIPASSSVILSIVEVFDN